MLGLAFNKLQSGLGEEGLEIKYEIYIAQG